MSRGARGGCCCIGPCREGLEVGAVVSDHGRHGLEVGAVVSDHGRHGLEVGDVVSDHVVRG